MPWGPGFNTQNQSINKQTKKSTKTVDFQRSEMGTGTIAQSIECLLCKHRRFGLQSHVEMLDIVVHTYIQTYVLLCRTGEMEIGGSLGLTGKPICPTSWAPGSVILSQRRWVGFPRKVSEIVFFTMVISMIVVLYPIQTGQTCFLVAPTALYSFARWLQ